MVFETFFCNPRTCYSTHKILLQSFSFLHYITTYSAYFNSPNNSARNLFLFEEKSREKPGRWFSTNFNSTPYWTMLRSQYRIQTGSSKLISLLLNFDAIVVVQMKYYWKDRYWKSKHFELIGKIATLIWSYQIKIILSKKKQAIFETLCYHGTANQRNKMYGHL